MSAKLLKRMLQETNNHDDEAEEEQKQQEGRPSISSKKKRRRKGGKGSPTAQHSDLIKYQIQGMLFMDKMVSKSSSEKGVGGSLARINRNNAQKSQIRRESASIQIGNSRSCSSKMTLKQEPTFNKKLHKEQTEKKKLLAVARLLKKNSVRKRK